MKFFGLCLDLVLDKVAKNFWVDGGFDVDGHSRVLCGGAIQDDFQFFCHSRFAGKGLESGELTGPTLDEKFFQECGVGSEEWVEDYLLDGRRFGRCGGVE